MTKCPRCGSTAQVKILNKEYVKSWDNSQVNLVTHCQCGCGIKFQHTIIYVQAAEPIVEEK